MVRSIIVVIKLSTPVAIIIASGIVVLSIAGIEARKYYHADRYKIVAVDTEIFRLNKRTGMIVVCRVARNPMNIEPPGKDPFADIMGPLYRPVDKVMVECGHEQKF